MSNSILLVIFLSEFNVILTLNHLMDLVALSSSAIFLLCEKFQQEILEKNKYLKVSFVLP